MVTAGQERVERRLLERDADERAHLRPFLDHVVPADASGARGRRKQGGQDVDGGGLARAVRAEKAVDLAGSDGEVDPVHRARAFPVLADETFDLDPVRLVHRAHSTDGPPWRAAADEPRRRRRGAQRPPRQGRAERPVPRPRAARAGASSRRPACRPLVRDVDGVVLPVGARDPDPHREPAPEPELPLGPELLGRTRGFALRSGSRFPPASPRR